MQPILYDYAERRYTTNGIGRLPDCIKCTVTEERNGIYELEFDYPITGERYSDIQEGRVIGVAHDETGDIQPFDIYGRTAPIDGVVTFYAHHISYRLSNIAVMAFTADSIASTFTEFEEKSINANPFTFWTDKTTSAKFTNEKPEVIRALLGGTEGSVLDVFGGGEYEFDRFTVKLYQNRGIDSGVEIRYGKNLTDIKQEKDSSDVYNAVVPFYLGQDGVLVTLPEKMLVYTGAITKTTNLTDESLVIIREENDEPIEIAYKQIDAVPMDLSTEFQETPTVEELRAAAMSRFQNSDGWVPSENISVNFVQLWQTEEYKNVAPLQRVGLCDTVSVFYDELGVNAVKMKVVKTVYNVLLDRYDSMELGQLQTNLANAITGDIKAQLRNVATKSMMEYAVDHATELIRGGLGGYVVMKPNANGQPEEILILDKPDINEAVQVWRWNKGGLGHSSHGYNGPYDDVAITMDGQINAEAITTGTMSANRIKGGTLTLGGRDNGDGVIYMNDASGNRIGTWDSDGLAATKVNLSGAIRTVSNKTFTEISRGVLTAGYVENNVDTVHGVIDCSHQYTDSGVTTTNNASFLSKENMLILGAKGTIWFTDETGTGTPRAWITSAGRLCVNSGWGPDAGTTVKLPAAIASGGAVTSSYTVKVIRGIIYPA